MNLKATIPPNWNPGQTAAINRWYQNLDPRNPAPKPAVKLCLNEVETFCFVHNSSYSKFILNLEKTLNP